MFVKCAWAVRARSVGCCARLENTVVYDLSRFVGLVQNKSHIAIFERKLVNLVQARLAYVHK